MLRWIRTLFARRRRMPKLLFDFPFPKELRYTRCYETSEANYTIRATPLEAPNGERGPGLDE